MKYILIAVMAALLLSANALAAIKIDGRQARNWTMYRAWALSISTTIWPLSKRPIRPLTS